MVSGIVHETEILTKYMSDFLPRETAVYINDLLESYYSCCRDVEDEKIYLKEFKKIFEIAKNQLKKQGIEYDMLVAAHVIEE